MNSINISRNTKPDPNYLTVEELEPGRTYLIINPHDRFHNHVVIPSNGSYAVIGEQVSNKFIITSADWISNVLIGGKGLLETKLNIHVLD